MCDPNRAPVKTAWNEWLQERDRAPGEVLAEWLVDKTQESLGVAAEYAKAGLDIAARRARITLEGRELLDKGGEAAQEAIRVKQLCRRAVAIDSDIIQRLGYFSSFYQEEASFSSDSSLRSIYVARAKLYSSAVEALGESPNIPTMTPVEIDASAILQFRQAKAQVGRQLSIGASSDGGRSPGARSSSAPARGGGQRPKADSESLESLIAELFRLHDLKANGVIEEVELIKLNEKIALLHHGKDIDKSAVKIRFQEVFRENLDPKGRPVAYPTFHRYMLRMLEELDANVKAQVMIVEQFVEEARSARAAFRFPSLATESDAPFLSTLSLSEDEAEAVAAAAAMPSVGAASERLLVAEHAPGRPNAMSMADRVQLVAAAGPSSPPLAGPRPRRGSEPPPCRSDSGGGVWEAAGLPKPPTLPERAELPRQVERAAAAAAAVTASAVTASALVGPGRKAAEALARQRDLVEKQDAEAAMRVDRGLAGQRADQEREVVERRSQAQVAEEETLGMPAVQKAEEAEEKRDGQQVAGLAAVKTVAAGRPPTAGAGAVQSSCAAGFASAKSGASSSSGGSFVPSPSRAATVLDSIDSFVPSPSLAASIDSSLSSLAPSPQASATATEAGKAAAPAAPVSAASPGGASSMTSVSASSASGTASSAAGASTCSSMNTQEAPAAPWFSKGEAIEVWSNSRGAWLEGVVEEAFAVSCEAEGYRIPAGTLKVSSLAGVKWVMPGQEGAVLRRRLGGIGPGWTAGRG
mmetsp:Transcript_106812/g.238330  ORF Transcript_106812/g.238330 Transcript_106812/m.238330 type:complete len:753 (-) Transcript_106812:7-2265(-)